MTPHKFGENLTMPLKIKSDFVKPDNNLFYFAENTCGIKTISAIISTIFWENDLGLGSFTCSIGCVEKINFSILNCGSVDYGVVGYTETGNVVKNEIKAWEVSLKFTYFSGKYINFCPISSKFQ